MGVRDDEPVLGPSCGAGVIGAPTCSSNYLTRLLGKAERSPAGTRGASETWRLTIVPTGASGPGKWKWFSRTRAWEAPAQPPPPGPRAWRSATRAGPARDLPGGEGDASSVRGSPVSPAAPLCSARRGEGAPRRGARGPAMAAQGGSTARRRHPRHRLGLGDWPPGGRGPSRPRPRRTLRRSRGVDRPGCQGEGPYSAPPPRSPLRLRSRGRAERSQALRAGLCSCPKLGFLKFRKGWMDLEG